MKLLKPEDAKLFRLLELSPFERRPGGWRFGTKAISDAVIARLIASRLAVEDGNLLRLASPGDRA